MNLSQNKNKNIAKKSYIDVILEEIMFDKKMYLISYCLL